MKKFVSLMMALCLIFSLTACAAAEEGPMFDKSYIKGIDGQWVEFADAGLKMYIPTELAALELTEEMTKDNVIAAHASDLCTIELRFGNLYPNEDGSLNMDAVAVWDKIAPEIATGNLGKANGLDMLLLIGFPTKENSITDMVYFLPEKNAQFSLKFIGNITDKNNKEKLEKMLTVLMSSIMPIDQAI